jgi:hypothetical protein
MDEQIRVRLLETSNDLSLFAATPPSLVEQVFRFQPMSEMETTNSAVLSQYTIMMAQYLISLQVRYNTSRVIASQKKKVLDRKVAELLQAGAVEGKTLKEREANAVASSLELQELEREYDEAAAERDLLEGIDKPITELINAFKAELRRRADERYHMDRERT